MSGDVTEMARRWWVHRQDVRIDLAAVVGIACADRQLPNRTSYQVTVSLAGSPPMVFHADHAVVESLLDAHEAFFWGDIPNPVDWNPEPEVKPDSDPEPP